MDEADIREEARDYVEHVVRTSNRDLASVPPKAMERALKAAEDSTAELRKAAELAQEADR